MAFHGAVLLPHGRCSALPSQPLVLECPASAPQPLGGVEALPHRVVWHVECDRSQSIGSWPERIPKAGYWLIHGKTGDAKSQSRCGKVRNHPTRHSRGSPPETSPHARVSLRPRIATNSIQFCPIQELGARNQYERL